MSAALIFFFFGGASEAAEVEVEVEETRRSGIGFAVKKPHQFVDDPDFKDHRQALPEEEAEPEVRPPKRGPKKKKPKPEPVEAKADPAVIAAALVRQAELDAEIERKRAEEEEDDMLLLMAA